MSPINSLNFLYDRSLILSSIVCRSGQRKEKFYFKETYENILDSKQQSGGAEKPVGSNVKRELIKTKNS